MGRALRLGFGAATLLLGACTEPVDAGLDYHPLVTAAATTVPQAPRGCGLGIVEITDLRLDPATLGSIGGRVVHGPADSGAWLRNVLTGLGSYGIEVSFPAGEKAPSLTASVTLVTAWVESLAVAKTSSVVLDARYRRDGAVVKEARYRGAESTVNWFSSGDEIRAMIEDSWTQILAAMSGDAAALCAAPAG